jgi:hypothetical protein
MKYPRLLWIFEDARSCSSPRADSPFRSHHLSVSLRLIGQTKTPPLARRLAAGLAVRPAPHTMLRIVFVAVDRTTAERSVTHSHDASGARTHR